MTNRTTIGRLIFNRFLLSVVFLTPFFALQSQTSVSQTIMDEVYEKVKTPYKYGLVLVPQDNTKMVDSPSVFRYGNFWYMTYIVFDGKGYETWLAKSQNLLQWETLGKILSFSENSWDANQKAGYIALQDYRWGGSYELTKYDNNFWMSYLGGNTKGYEAGRLGIGMAFSDNPIDVKEWNCIDKPVISATDDDARWYDNQTIYKSSVIHDKSKTTGYPFVMFYNAKGKAKAGEESAERISMAVSNDMVHWKRYGENPIIDHQTGISGDAYITKMDNLWVMFYFGAFWKPGAFDRFACSYDLKNWTVWNGEDLVESTEPYDNQFAHKPCVIKYRGIVYHFYCAVNDKNERTIALATSKDIGRSNLQFPSK